MPSIPEIIQALPIILSLVIIEGLLSVDNALAIAAMASHLPGRQKVLALRWGIIGAYAFRGVALAFASFIIHNPWLKIVGAAYLIYLTAHFFAEKARKSAAEDDGGTDSLNASALAQRGFWGTVASIELMDLSLSVDNVVAAVAMSPRLWVVCTGVFIGILALRFVAGVCIKLIGRFPILESSAFLLIGYVGCILIAELTAHHVFALAAPLHVSSLQKFLGIAIILALSIGFSESRALRTFLSPFLRLGRAPLIAFAAVCNAVFKTLLAPVHFFLQLFKRKETVADPGADL
jgi:tellurite resistance protein TerC